MSNKDSYLNRERKHSANYMRKSGHADVLATRKSIGRKGQALRNKLTGIKGFGEGDPKPEKKRVHSDIEKNPQNYRHYD